MSTQENIPGTLAGRFGQIEAHFADALTAIEEEIELTPEGDKKRLRFLESVRKQAADGMFRTENHIADTMSLDDGFLEKHFHKFEGETEWREGPAPE